jgi:hypothetical protein
MQVVIVMAESSRLIQFSQTASCDARENLETKTTAITRNTLKIVTEIIRAYLKIFGAMLIFAFLAGLFFGLFRGCFSSH